MKKCSPSHKLHFRLIGIYSENVHENLLMQIYKFFCAYVRIVCIFLPRLATIFSSSCLHNWLSWTSALTTCKDLNNTFTVLWLPNLSWKNKQKRTLQSDPSITVVFAAGFLGCPRILSKWLLVSPLPYLSLIWELAVKSCMAHLSVNNRLWRKELSTCILLNQSYSRVV